MALAVLTFSEGFDKTVEKRKRKAMVKWDYISAQKSVLDFFFFTFNFHTGPQ